MKKRMPFYNDDRSILITVEFWENGYLKKNGQRCIRRFELDLILRDDITLDQLIDALDHGIEDRLRSHYGLDPGEYDVAFLYEDQYIHDPAGASDADFAEDAAEDSGQRTKNSWLICLKLLQACRQEYVRGYPETQDATEEAAVFPPHMPHHPVIACSSINLNMRSPDEVLSVAHKSQLWLDQQHHGGKTLKELGFVSSSRLIFDPAMWHRSDVLFDDVISTIRLRLPSPTYHAGTQELVDYDRRKVQIQTPPEPVRPKYTAMIGAITAPLVMLGTFLALSSVTGLALPATTPGVLAGTMVAATALCSLIAWIGQRCAYRMELKLSCADYERYMQSTLADIRKRRKHIRELMHKRYPPALDLIGCKDLVHMANTSNGELFSRTESHPDFLHVRLGVSADNTVLVPNPFPIGGEIQSQTYSGLRYCNLENCMGIPFTLLPPIFGARRVKNPQPSGKCLSELTEDISRQFGHLDHAPVLLDLGRSRAVGLLMPNRNATPGPFIANLMLDLCFHHSPDDVQVVMFLRETDDQRSQQEAICFYKHLPHCRKLLDDMSPFAFNAQQARQIMDRIYQKLIAPSQHKQPHILLIIEQDHGLHSHPLSRLLPNCEEDVSSNISGITFFMCSHSQANLPRFCTQVIKITDNDGCYLLPFHQVSTDGSLRRYAFTPDTLPYRISSTDVPEKITPYFRAFKTISALSCLEFGRNDQIPMTSYFQLLEDFCTQLGFSLTLDPAHLDADLRRYLAEYEKRRRVDRRIPLSTLAVPVGRSDAGITMLDLHADAGGPHALIFSDPGMGKTELLVTCLSSLCLHHPSEQVSVIPVDVYPGGLAERLRSLKHIQPLFPGDSANRTILASDIAQRLITILDQNIHDRTKLLSTLGVSSIDEYNLALKDLNHHALYRLHMAPEDADIWIRQHEQIEAIPHLFLVIDNLHHLQTLLGMEGRFLNLQDSLANIMQQCTKLGIHLILATAKINPDTDQDFLACFNTRICLKTADPAAAAAVVGDKLPAEPFFPEDGRALLRCGQPPRMEHFQTSYFVADKPAQPVRITLANPGGSYELFYDSRQQGSGYAAPDGSADRPPEDDAPRNDHRAEEAAHAAGHSHRSKATPEYDANESNPNQWPQDPPKHSAGESSNNGKDSWPEGYTPKRTAGESNPSGKDRWPEGYAPRRTAGESNPSGKDRWPEGYAPKRTAGESNHSGKDRWPEGYDPNK